MKKLEHYIIKDGKKLRCGYTTGSCATAASKSSVILFLNKIASDSVEIDTPKGIRLEIDIETCKKVDDSYISSVKKDSGDDPDVTDGIEIFSKVTPRADNKINIFGGIGVGLIRVGGFWGKPGDSAINKGPKEMIVKEIRELTDRGFDIEISVPDGLEVAKRTYNRNIGIEGGISIIGTSGIVEPMSEEALKKSIYLELDAIRQKTDQLLMYPGNYGEKLADELYNNKRGVKVSNFIGDALKYAQSLGFKKVILVGHIGKLSKLAIGAFNTHSNICDMRIESFIYYLALKKRYDRIDDLMDCLTTEEAVKKLIKSDRDIFRDMERGISTRIKKYLKDESFDIEVVIYSMEYGVL